MCWKWGTSLLIVIWAAREVASGSFSIRFKSDLHSNGPLCDGSMLIQMSFHLTAYWYATLVKSAALDQLHTGLFFLVSQEFHQKPWIYAFGLFCTGYGFLFSLFAIVQQFTWNGKIYWMVPNRVGGWVLRVIRESCALRRLDGDACSIPVPTCNLQSHRKTCPDPLSLRSRRHEQHNLFVLVPRRHDGVCGRARCALADLVPVTDALSTRKYCCSALLASP